MQLASCAGSPHPAPPPPNWPRTTPDFRCHDGPRAPHDRPAGCRAVGRGPGAGRPGRLHPGTAGADAVRDRPARRRAAVDRAPAGRRAVPPGARWSATPTGATASGCGCGSSARWRPAGSACARRRCRSWRTCTRSPTRTCSWRCGTASRWSSSSGFGRARSSVLTGSAAGSPCTPPASGWCCSRTRRWRCRSGCSPRRCAGTPPHPRRPGAAAAGCSPRCGAAGSRSATGRSPWTRCPSPRPSRPRGEVVAALSVVVPAAEGRAPGLIPAVRVAAHGISRTLHRRAGIESPAEASG